MSTARYLVDKSALARIRLEHVAQVLDEALVRGVLGVSILTELEMGFSARSVADYATRPGVISSISWYQ